MKTFGNTVRNPLFWDRLLVACTAVYGLGIFLPEITALERLGLVAGLLIALAGGRWKVARDHLGHPLLLLLGIFLGWLLLSAAWSIERQTTLDSWSSVFKDYFLILPALFFLLDDPQRRRWLGLALAAWGGVIVLLNGAQYVREFIEGSERLLDIKAHRGWGHPLVYFLPFALMQAALARGRAAMLWYALFAVEAAMIFATGARGAWLALFAVLALWGMYYLDKRRAMILLAIGVVLAAASYLLLPPNLFKDRVHQGADTSLRTSGTWGPAIQMMDERPLLGFGFGKEIFNREFNRRAPDEAGWSIKKSKGPHSIYLEAGFAGGYPGLALITLLFVATFGYAWRAVVTCADVEEKAFALAAWASFTGFYITRGAFESVRWAPMIILICIIVHLARRGALQDKAGGRARPSAAA